MPLYIMETVSSDSGVMAPRAPGLEIEARPIYAFPEKGDLSSDERTESIEKMQSVIAVAWKVIRIFYMILTKGVAYDGIKMLEDIQRPALAMK